MLDCKMIRLAAYIFELNKLQFLTFLMTLTLIKKIQLRSNLIVLQTQGVKHLDLDEQQAYMRYSSWMVFHKQRYCTYIGYIKLNFVIAVN